MAIAPQPVSDDLVTPIQPDSEIEEINQLLLKISQATLPQDLKDKAMSMVGSLQKVIKYGSFSREFEPVEKYISVITSIPWDKFTTDDLDLAHVKSQLDKTHFGVENIKERILEYVAMLNLIRKKNDSLRSPQAPAVSDSSALPGLTAVPINEMAKLQGSSAHAPILCLVGIQGIGKTSIAKSISTALGRQFVRISLGGLAGVSELRGRSRGQVDAEPGQVIKALVKTGVMNPMILLDEVDKVSTTSRADVMAALLEVLDPEQNSTFRDNYIDYPVDLSQVLFVCTANNLGGVSAALLDRLEVIRMISYSDEEKMHIARDYLLPKVMENSGLEPGQIQFDDRVWPYVIRPLGFDAGVRELERTITTLVRKVAKQIVMGEGTQYVISPENFRQYIPEQLGVVS